MAVVVHSRRVNHLGSATIVLSLPLFSAAQSRSLSQEQVDCAAIMREKTWHMTANSILFFPCLMSSLLFASLLSFFFFFFFLQRASAGFFLFLFLFRLSSFLLQRLSSNQLVKTASDVADVVRLSVWRVDSVFQLDLERKLPFVDYIIPGGPCSKGLVKAVVHAIGEHVPSKPGFLFEPGCCLHPVRKRPRLLDRHRLAHWPLVDGVRLCNVHAEELAFGCVVTLQLLEVVKDLQERRSGIRTGSHHQRAVVPAPRRCSS